MSIDGKDKNETHVRIDFISPVVGRRGSFGGNTIKTELINLSTGKEEVILPPDTRSYDEAFDKYKASLTITKTDDENLTITHRYTPPPFLGIDLFAKKEEESVHTLHNFPEDPKGSLSFLLYSEDGVLGTVSAKVVDPLEEEKRQSAENRNIDRAAELGAFRGSRKDRTPHHRQFVKHHIGAVTVKRKDHTP